MQIIAPAETRTVLENVRWDTFEELAERRPGSVPRMTYDEGVLELLSPMRRHEHLGRIIGRIVETYSEVRGIEISSCASTTFKRRDLQKAFEPDESYYIEFEEQMRSKDDTDLTIDPPPDLVIEVEITSSAIRKMKLFAALGVPEVWRHDGKQIRMFVLRENRDELPDKSDPYDEVTSSAALSGLTTETINSLVDRRFDVGESALIREFRNSMESPRD